MVFAAVGCGNAEIEETKSSSDVEVSQETSVVQSSSVEETPEVIDTDPFGAYEEPITLTTIVAQTLTQACPEGITLEKNPWQDLWESYGINVEYDAIAADNTDLTSKINLAVASEELPDYMSVSYALYQELLEADMIADLTDVFEQYASDEFKALMYADGGAMADTVTVDGRLYGIVQPANYHGLGGVVAIRRDWMEELGMEAPDSIDELWALGKAFMDNKMDGTCTYGIGSTKDIAAQLSMRYLINAHGGNVTGWQDVNGKLVYGLIQPEMKQALMDLNAYYEAGILDKEYGTKTEKMMFEDALAGKCGIVVCNMTGPFYTDNGLTLGQDWAYYPLYGKEEGTYAPVEIGTNISSCVVVSKDCKNPEAVIKLFNMFIKYGTEEPETYASNGINNCSHPAVITQVAANLYKHLAYVEYRETGKLPENAIAGSQDIVDQCERYRLENSEADRIIYTIFSLDGTQSILKKEIDNGGYLISEFTGAPGAAQVKYGGNLGTLANQMITNIITGAKEPDYFHEFVAIWKANGGDEITEEVNEWYQSR